MNFCLIDLVGQSYMMAYAIVAGCLLLGLLPVAVPRPRKNYQTRYEIENDTSAKKLVKVKRDQPAVRPPAR